MAQFSRNQKLFAAAYAKATGWDPRAVEAQMIAEEPAGANSGYRGTQDWLNIGITDSGPMGQNNKVWQDPAAAGKFSGEWATGKVSDPGFGHASSSIVNAVRGTAGKGVNPELAAIAASDWAGSHYGGAAALESLVGQTGGIGKLPNTPGGGVTQTTTTTTKNGRPQTQPMVKGGSVTPGVTITKPNIYSALEGLEAARQVNEGDTTGTPDALQAGWASLANLIAPSLTTTTPGHVQGEQLLKAIGPNQSQKGVTNVRNGMTRGGGGSNVLPLRGWNIGRTDMGVDASSHVGAPIRAINDSVITDVHTFYAGQPIVTMRILSGPDKGKYWYVSEQVVRQGGGQFTSADIGRHIPRNGVVAQFAPSGTGIEIGWAGSAGGSTLAQTQGNTGDSSHNNSPAGLDFAKQFTSPARLRSGNAGAGPGSVNPELFGGFVPPKANEPTEKSPTPPAAGMRGKPPPQEKQPPLPQYKPVSNLPGQLVADPLDDIAQDKAGR